MSYYGQQQPPVSAPPAQGMSFLVLPPCFRDRLRLVPPSTWIREHCRLSREGRVPAAGLPARGISSAGAGLPPAGLPAAGLPSAAGVSAAGIPAAVLAAAAAAPPAAEQRALFHGGMVRSLLCPPPSPPIPCGCRYWSRRFVFSFAGDDALGGGASGRLVGVLCGADVIAVADSRLACHCQRQSASGWMGRGRGGSRPGALRAREVDRALRSSKSPNRGPQSPLPPRRLSLLDRLAIQSGSSRLVG